MIQRLQRLYRFVRRHISSIAFASGFILDTLTLKRIDLVYENAVFITYLVVAFTGMLLIHGVETHRFTWKPLVSTKYWLPALVQFPLGGLFSGFVIFYTKSASLFTSWPFVALLVALLVGNEFLRKRYVRLVFQTTVFFFALLSYLVLVTPMILGTVGTATFILANISAVFVMSLLMRLMQKLFDELYKRNAQRIWLGVISILIGFNVLYFTNTIPPVPLALKEIGVYHSVIHVENEYQLRYEAPHPYVFWRDTAKTFHRAPGEAAYCYSSIFAPTVLNAKIWHSWQRKSDRYSGAWVRVDRIPYSLTGGREDGYRAYTIKTNLDEGEWRCVVETDSGLVIGEMRFDVVDVDEPVPLTDGVR